MTIELFWKSKHKSLSAKPSKDNMLKKLVSTTPDARFQTLRQLSLGYLLAIMDYAITVNGFIVALKYVKNRPL